MKDEMLGALVGWDVQPLGNRLTLRLQATDKQPPLAKSDVDSVYVVLDRNQAAQLANFMATVSGNAPAPGKRSWLRRLLGV